MQKKITTILAALLIAAGLSGAYITLTPEYAYAAGFSDTSSHWSRDAIDKWVGLGILNGVSDDRFEPNRAISRAEFLAIVNRTFGATQTADISRFRDVAQDSWYYNDIAKAYKMGTTTGTSTTEMSPNAIVTRQDAVTLLARALGISSDSNTALSGYTDAYQVSAYARPYVSAFVARGYLNGYNGILNPNGQLSRAEAVTLLDNLFTEVASGTMELVSSGSVLVRTAGTTISGTINGDLIIADGVGTGDVNVEDCTITGRLILRGGGVNSVKMTGSTAQGGVYVQNPNGRTRLVLTESSAGSIVAKTGLALEGNSVNSITIPADTAEKPQISLADVTLNSFSAAAPAEVQLVSGTVGSINMQQGSDGSAIDVATGARITNLNIGAQNVSVTGSGVITDLKITSSGANVAAAPQAYSIGDNLSAIINGVTHYGKTSATGGSNTTRASSAMYVTQNSAMTGGNSLSFSTTSASDGNTVNVSQSGSTKIPLTARNGRLAYWIGFFIPAPADTATSATVTYYYDGTATNMNVSTSYKSSVRGIEFLVPVTRGGGGTYSGELSDEIFVKWSSGQYETMKFTSGALNLQELSAAEEATLVGYYTGAAFYGYNGTTYSGAEAIRRLLASDNALGLDTRGFATLSTADMTTAASALYSEVSKLTTRDAIQERLMVAMSGYGALYSVNRAISAERVKEVIESKNFAGDLGLSEAELAKYFTLSQVGRLSVAKTILLGRGDDYEDEEALIDALIKAVNSVRTSETKLLTTINSAKTGDEMKKLLETKANALLIDIITDADPYKSLTAEQKTSVAAQVLAATPYPSLDTVNKKFIDLVGEPDDGSTPVETNKVMSVSAEQTTFTLVTPTTAEIKPIVTMTSGVDTAATSVNYSSGNTNVAVVDGSGIIRALSKGTATITLTSKQDATKKATVKVTVTDPVDATAIKLNITESDIDSGGGTVKVTATLTPSNSTSAIKWTSINESICTVSVTGKVATITGVNPGVTTITASIEDNSTINAICTVTVHDITPGITITPSTLSVGVGLQSQLTASISPLSRAGEKISWSVHPDDIGVVAVSPTNGVVTGVAAGTARVIAKTADGTLSSECVVTVDPAISGVMMSDNSLVVYKNGAVALSAESVPTAGKTIKWDYDSKYVTLEPVLDDAGNPINGKMMIIGKLAGTITVTAYLQSDATAYAECEVTISSTEIKTTLINAATSKAVTTLAMQLGGKDELLKVSFSPDSIVNKTVTWVSDRPDIVTVDSNGRLKVVGMGVDSDSDTLTAMARITATPQANQSKPLECIVTVTKTPVTSVTLNLSSIKLDVGLTQKLTATVKPDNASIKTVTWISSDPFTVSVNQNGQITALKPTVSYETVQEQIGVDSDNKPIYKDVVITRDDQVEIIASCDEKTVKCLVTVPYGKYVRVDDVTIDLVDSWVFKAGTTTSSQIPLIFNKDDPTGDVLPSDKNVTWFSDNESAAYIDENGCLVARMPGIATIRVTTPNGVMDSKIVVVADAGITGLTLSGTETTTKHGNLVIMELGEKKQITATPKNTDWFTDGLEWTSLNPDIVKVDQKGNLTAVSPGWAKINILPSEPARLETVLPSDSRVILNETDGNPRNSPVYSVITKSVTDYIGPNSSTPLDPTKRIPLVVRNEVTDSNGGAFWVCVAPAEPEMSPELTVTQDAEAVTGSKVTLTAELSWSNSKTVTWTIDGGQTFTSEDNATVSGKASASFTPTAAGTYNVTVEAAIEEILGTNNFVLQPGTPVKTTYTITVTDPAIQAPAGISSGIGGIAIAPPATPVEPAKPAPTGVKLRATAFAEPDEIITLVPYLTPYNADTKKLIWSSSDEMIAKVENGVVKAVSTGTAKITVTDATGKLSSTCTVTIKKDSKPVTSIAISKKALAVNAGASSTLTVTYKPSNAAFKGVTWSSEDETIARVEPNGKVVGVSGGTVKITATSDSGALVATCTVTVRVPVKAVTIPTNKITLKVGEKYQIPATVEPSDATDAKLTYSSRSSAIAAVSSTGLISAKKAGTTTITIKAGTKYVTLTVTVEK